MAWSRNLPVAGSGSGTVTPSPVAMPQRVYLDGTEYWEFDQEIIVPAGGAVVLNQQNIKINTDPYIYAGKNSPSHGLYIAGTNYRPTATAGFAQSIDANGQGVALGIADAGDRVLTIAYSSEGRIGLLGARFDFTRKMEGYFRNFKVYDENQNLIHHIPLTNVSEGAAQKDLVGNVTANLISSHEPVFEEYV